MIVIRDCFVPRKDVLQGEIASYLQMKYYGIEIASYLAMTNTPEEREAFVPSKDILQRG